MPYRQTGVPWIERQRRTYEFVGEAIKRAKRKCEYCGGPYEELHHIIPISCGGEHSLNNLICLCHDCHFRAHNCDYKNKNGLNEEMLNYFQQLNEERSYKSLSEILEDINQLLEKSTIDSQRLKWKKTLAFHDGKRDAFQQVLEMFTHLKE